VLVDARSELPAARILCRLLAGARVGVPVIAVLTEAGLAGVSGEWKVDEIVLADTGAAELDARLRLVVTRRTGVAALRPHRRQRHRRWSEG
jgi:hypothetical protein